MKPLLAFIGLSVISLSASASKPMSTSCKEVLLKLSPPPPLSESAVVDPVTLNELRNQYYPNSDEPEALKNIFSILQQGRISFSLFEKIRTGYPTINKKIALLFYK